MSAKPVAISARRRLLVFCVATSMPAGVLWTAAAAQQTRFRSAVDLIAVDVQVIDKEGVPVPRLGPESFEVSLGKQRRQVVSVQFVRHASASTPDPLPAAAPAVEAVETVWGGGRTFILAVDNGSFEPGTAAEPMRALQEFLQGLDPRDRVGLYVFPSATWIDPITERGPIRVRLGTVIGEKQALRSHYNLKPSEIVDISAQSTNPNSFLTSRGRATTPDPAVGEALDPVRVVQARECPGDVDCLSRIYAEGMELAIQLENETQTSLSGLDTLLQRIAGIPGRKAVVLVSAGVLVADRLDGRPDIGDLGRRLGQTAARANAIVYTLHIEANAGLGTAARRGPGSSERGRERAMFATFLDQFSSGAGGSRIYVPVGGGAFAMTRLLRESSAYYLLGVEPAEADRDGRARELRVKVKRRGVTVRSRQWVLVPRRG